jgi:hypothetical protein
MGGYSHLHYRRDQVLPSGWLTASGSPSRKDSARLLGILTMQDIAEALSKEELVTPKHLDFDGEWY